MSVTPSGNYSTFIDKFCDLIAGSSTFQTWVGAASSAAAKLKVYPAGIIRSEAEYPTDTAFCVVGVPELAYSQSGYVSASRVDVFFESKVPPQYRNFSADAFYDHANKVGPVVDEIMVNSENTSGAIYIQTDSIFLKTQRSAEQENDDYFQTRVTFQLGLKSAR